MHDFEQEPAELRRPSEPGRRREQSKDEKNLKFASLAGNRAIQRLLDSGGSTHPSRAAGETLQRKIEGKRGAGESLSPSARAKSERALGQDFSDVRVHRDSEADGLSRSLKAKAFTTGNDIFFKSDAYDPDSASGQKLLAHELTHVFQQRSAGSVEAKISDPADASEHQAEHLSEAITQGSAVQRIAAVAPAGISLDDDEEALEEQVEELQDEVSEVESEVEEEEGE